MLPKLRDDSRLDQCNWTITNIQSVLLQPESIVLRINFFLTRLNLSYSF